MELGLEKIRLPFTPEYFHHEAVLEPGRKWPEL
jgi:hypothetical protein